MRLNLPMLVVSVCLLVAASACAGSEIIADEPIGTTTQTTDPSGGAAATTVGGESTVEEVLLWMDANHPGSAPACDETGRVEVGDVFVCARSGATVPGTTAPVESGGWVIYVLDESGRAAWNSATDIPVSTDGLLSDYRRVPKGLRCRDLLDDEVDAYPFRQLSTPRVNYFWSLVYWSLEGKPERMDADRDGIPCETLYDPAVISDVLAGGPVS